MCIRVEKVIKKVKTTFSRVFIFTIIFLLVHLGIYVWQRKLAFIIDMTLVAEFNQFSFFIEYLAELILLLFLITLRTI